MLDVILMKCRNVSISYSAFKKKEQTALEQELIRDLTAAEEDLAMSNDEEAADYIQGLRLDLEQIREEKMRGAQIRSRGKWAVEGEKPTAYFCSLESHNFSEKYIPCLRVGGDLLTKQEDILNATADHYGDLLRSPGDREYDNSLGDFLEGALSDVPTLSEEEKEITDEAFTYEEATMYVRSHLKNGKSLGSSGFPAEFFKVFWSCLGRHSVNAMNHSHERGLLSTIQRQGIITLIPKPGRDPATLKGYRPISLLNTWYKICSGILAERLKKLLQEQPYD